MPDAAEMVANALAERKLSTRDKNLRDNLTLPPWVEQEGMSQDLRPENIAALGRAIDRASGKEKAILQQEMNRLRELAGNLMGPVEMPPQPEGQIGAGDVQRMPFNPAEGRPGYQIPNALPNPTQQTFTDSPGFPRDQWERRPGYQHGVNTNPVVKPQIPVIIHRNLWGGVRA